MITKTHHILAKLNEELCEDLNKNKLVRTRAFFEKLTKIKRLIRKCINNNLCSFCGDSVYYLKGNREDHNYGTEYLVSGLCPKCQDEEMKETN